MIRANWWYPRVNIEKCLWKTRDAATFVFIACIGEFFFRVTLCDFYISYYTLSKGENATLERLDEETMTRRPRHERIFVFRGGIEKKNVIPLERTTSFYSTFQRTREWDARRLYKTVHTQYYESFPLTTVLFISNESGSTFTFTSFYLYT